MLFRALQMKDDEINNCFKMNVIFVSFLPNIIR